MGDPTTTTKVARDASVTPNATPDTVQRDAIERSIGVRLTQCNEDELRVVDLILSRLEVGRRRYGFLDLTKARDWATEEAEELLDARIYRACDELTVRAQLADEALAEREADARAERTAAEANNDRVMQALRDLRDTHIEKPRPVELSIDFGEER